MNPRSLWSPEVARHYGVRPWEMGLLTLRELEEIHRHHQEMSRNGD